MLQLVTLQGAKLPVVRLQEYLAHIAAMRASAAWGAARQQAAKAAGLSSGAAHQVRCHACPSVRCQSGFPQSVTSTVVHMLFWLDTLAYRRLQHVDGGCEV